MKRPYQIIGVVLVLFAALALREALQLEYFTPLGPGPGFFPVWMALLLGLSGAVIAYQATFKTSAPMPRDFIPSGIGAVRVGAVVLALAAVVALMEPLGFRLTMMAFQCFLLLTLGRQSLPLTVLVSLACSFGVYQVFVGYLDVPLPVGPEGMFGI